jgi:hypothetical protein
MVHTTASEHGEQGCMMEVDQDGNQNRCIKNGMCIMGS